MSELEKLTGASQPVISQHLTRMRLEGIVDCRRDGNFIYYRIRDRSASVLIESLEELFGL